MEIKIKFTQRRATYKIEEVTGVLNVSKEELDKFGLNVSVLQGSTFIYGSTSTVKLLWDKPADIKNCDLSALR